VSLRVDIPSIRTDLLLQMVAFVAALIVLSAVQTVQAG